jgi:hypothetical protein
MRAFFLVRLVLGTPLSVMMLLRTGMGMGMVLSMLLRAWLRTMLCPVIMMGARLSMRTLMTGRMRPMVRGALV